jgi:hypothetical protein
MDRLLGTLASRALRRGLRGEWMWLAVGMGAWSLRRARRRSSSPIWSGKVRPGQQLLVTPSNRRAKERTVPAEG